ncbi:class I SAM-dependent methyltransferase, partial [bacterium]|nr:class I SAM-dependent methyltransferase [bacterium]
MQYIPKLTKSEIEENHKYFIERVSIYKKRGIDFFVTRRSILEKVYPLKGRILEIGPGNGHTTLALAKAGYKFISIDKDKGSLKKTALNLVYENVLSMVKLFVMDGNVLSFGEDSFKNVIVVNLFHHLDKVNKMLLEIDRVLCAEGKV